MASSQGDVRSSPMACQRVRPEHDRAQSCAIALRSPASERPSAWAYSPPKTHARAEARMRLETTGPQRGVGPLAALVLPLELEQPQPAPSAPSSHGPTQLASTVRRERAALMLWPSEEETP
eukprot:scaffold38652_cov42-Phaeocystis_antarctica.AAC.1